MLKDGHYVYHCIDMYDIRHYVYSADTVRGWETFHHGFSDRSVEPDVDKKKVDVKTYERYSLVVCFC